MGRKSTIPEFNELDKVFSRNCGELYDIMMTNFNKRIKLIEASRDFLYDWLASPNNKLRANKMWDITKDANVDDVFPKKKGGKLKMFAMDPGSEDIGIWSLINLRDKAKHENGWCIEIGFGLENLSWYIGQFHKFGKKKEYFDSKVYGDICDSLKTKTEKQNYVGCEFNYTFQRDEGEKYIEITVQCENLSEKLVSQIHNMIKFDIIQTMLNKLKENNSSKITPKLKKKAIIKKKS